jgi:hypothetical protein
MGLSPYRDVFMVLSLASFGATIFISYYGSPVPKPDMGVLRTSALTVLGIAVGMLLFVLP